MSLDIGQILDGKYRILRVIGEGGMGAVYEGENIRIGRRVAIKVLHAQSADAPELRRRFEREAHVAAKIGSSNICDVLDLGDLPDNQSYLVMEYLEGEGLDVVLARRKTLSARELVPIACQLLDGLAAMHAANVIHRDLKPANVFITKVAGGREGVKILDFGISKFKIASEAVGQNTETGALLGTPLYMSPEQARGLPVDFRSDLYSAGVIFYRVLAGKLPFEAGNLAQLLFAIALEAPPPLAPLVQEPDASFAPIVMRAMSRSPDDRFATAQAFREAIEAWANESHPSLMVPGSGVPASVLAPPRSAATKGEVVSLAASAPKHDVTAPGWAKKTQDEAGSASHAPVALARTSVSGGIEEPSPVSDARPGTQQRTRIVAVGATLVVALAFGGFQLRRGHGSDAPQPPPIAVPATPTAQTSPVASEAAVTPTGTSSLPANPVASTSTSTPKPTSAPLPRPVASARPGPSSAPPETVAAPTPPASAASKPGRKIRTEL